MRHSFILTVGDPKCAKCKHPEIDHTDKATCEACPNVGPCELYPDYNGMLLCAECIGKEEAIRLSPEEARKRVQSLAEAQKIDSNVQVRSDVFNAATVSIMELKVIIDADTTIVQKDFKLAMVVTERLNDLKRAIFERRQDLIEKENQQNAHQVYLNNLSNKLRVEEREQIKLADINYKPNPVKVTKPRDTKVRKFDKTELNKYALESGLPASVIQQVCISKNMSPQQAAEHLKKVMAGLAPKE